MGDGMCWGELWETFRVLCKLHQHLKHAVSKEEAHLYGVAFGGTCWQASVSYVTQLCQ
jgi:hypothetical protein